jgi:hypothetical protein
VEILRLIKELLKQVIYDTSAKSHSPLALVQKW